MNSSFNLLFRKWEGVFLYSIRQLFLSKPYLFTSSLITIKKQNKKLKGGFFFFLLFRENKSIRFDMSTVDLTKCDNCRGYRLTCLFRNKIWWAFPCFGTSGCDVPVETQFLLLEAREESTIQDEDSEPTTKNTFDILILLVLDGLFRASLQGTRTKELEVWIIARLLLSFDTPLSPTKNSTLLFCSTSVWTFHFLDCSLL